MVSLIINIDIPESIADQIDRFNTCLTCPIALQLRKQLTDAGVYDEKLYAAVVAETFIGIRKYGSSRYTIKVPLPTKVQQFISLWDRHEDKKLLAVLPLKFSVDIPVR